MRGQERTYPLRLDQAADEREGDRIRGFRQRHHRIRVDARARNQRDARSIDPQTLDHRAVVEILHQHRGARAIQQPSQRQPHERARHADLRRVVDEHGAEAGHRIEAHDGKASGRERSDDGCRQRDVMSEIGLHATVELAHLAHDPDKVARVKAATTPGDRVQVRRAPRSRRCEPRAPSAGDGR